MNLQETLAIILGASDFTNAGLVSESAFKVSAQAFKQYCADISGLGLDAANILDLFDNPSVPTILDQAIDDFLVDRVGALKSTGKKVSDVIVYYVGHGVFAEPNDDYALALRNTMKTRVRTTAYHVVDLAQALKRHVRYSRRFVILDCCFAASAHTAFESAPLDAAVTQSKSALATRGTALLCASAKDRPAKSKLIIGPTSSGMTLFSECLLSVLREGVPEIAYSHLTLREVGLEVEQRMMERFASEGPRPQVKSPDERDGDPALMRLFPNPAHRPMSVATAAGTSTPTRETGLSVKGGPSLTGKSHALRSLLFDFSRGTAIMLATVLFAVFVSDNIGSTQETQPAQNAPPSQDPEANEKIEPAQTAEATQNTESEQHTEFDEALYPEQALCSELLLCLAQDTTPTQNTEPAQDTTPHQKTEPAQSNHWTRGTVEGKIDGGSPEWKAAQIGRSDGAEEYSLRIDDYCVVTGSLSFRDGDPRMLIADHDCKSVSRVRHKEYGIIKNTDIPIAAGAKVFFSCRTKSGYRICYGNYEGRMWAEAKDSGEDYTTVGRVWLRRLLVAE